MDVRALGLQNYIPPETMAWPSMTLSLPSHLL
jgi:hypothetical protein